MSQSPAKPLAVTPLAWSREGALPFEAQRLRFVRLVDALLGRLDREPDHPPVLFGGQSALLEDYLQLRPEREGRVREWIATGRLGAGPWYVTPDATLVGGESLVRNLQIGTAVARRFGGVHPRVELPEAGAPAQLPAIVAGFGLEALPAPRAPEAGGRLSARGALKRANAEAETLLTRWAEPFSTLAMALAGADYPDAAIRHAWKLTLENHAAGTIGGGGVDAVERQAIARFEQASTLAAALRQEAFAALQGDAPALEAGPHNGLRLYNPHPWAHTAQIECELLLTGSPQALPIVSLLDEAEQPVPHEVLGVAAAGDGLRLRLRVAASLPALGYRTLKVQRDVARESRHPELFAGNNWIENRYFKVRVLQGALEIFDKTAEETVLHFFEDQGDAGDTASFGPLEGESPVDSRAWHWDDWAIRDGAEALVLSLRGTWRLPENLGPDRSHRQGSTPLGIHVRVTLGAGVRRVEIETTLEHHSRDHRFRAAFKLPASLEQLHTDTAFGLATHAAGAGPVPMASVALLDRPWETCAVAAIGLHEVEAAGDTLYLTLLRAVGRATPEGGASVAAPEAQCPGTATYRYAWTAQSADESVGTVLRRAAAFTTPSAAMPLRDWPGYEEASWLSIDQPAWALGALKRHETSDLLVLRLVNTSSETKEGTVSFGFPIRSVSHARLDETPGEAVVASETGFTLAIAPGAIATFLVEAGG